MFIDFGSTYTKVTGTDLDSEEILGTSKSAKETAFSAGTKVLKVYSMRLLVSTCKESDYRTLIKKLKKLR